MNTKRDQEELERMIKTFTLCDLQKLIGFSGGNKYGKKYELQSRALKLATLRSTSIQAKIRELYKTSRVSQIDITMNQRPGQQAGMNYNMHYMNLMAGAGVSPFASNAAALAAASAAASSRNQVSLERRNPYATGPASGFASLYYGLGQQHPQTSLGSMGTTRQVPTYPDISFVKLPFYDVQAELLRPTTLPVHGNSRFHEAQYQFSLTPQQATDIASHRDMTATPQPEYIYQVQLRFCQLSLESGKEMPDEFPPSVCLQVNGKMANLPNPIPTNKAGVEPKRPPKPVDITQLCKLSPILPNNINIKWASGIGNGWVVSICLVVKLNSSDLLKRLKQKGTRNPEFTRGLIVEKLNDDDEVATTSIKVSVSCPLGKMRMKVPCRPSTCSHLQCFDASLFLQMNERKPTWNCPVCDSKALYDTLLIDGYFQEVLNSSDLDKDENEIILERDGTWKPVPKDEEKTKPPSSLPPSDPNSNGMNAGSKKNDEEVECIDLSDDEDMPPLPSGPGPNNGPHAPPQVPFPPPLPVIAPPPPPIHPPEIECIDLE